jgi:(p)ppGpp synthase/HD superfamily hydrolase
MNTEYDLSDSEGLLGSVSYILRVHDVNPRAPHKAYRQWDGKTPYSVHPIWCAMTILTETTLNEKQRQDGAIALLYHDILEDTTVPLPTWLPPEVKKLVEDMTFYGGSKEEMEKVWEKSPFVRLLKLYDKVSNLLDGRNTWMSKKEDPNYRQKYEGYTLSLCADVEKNFGRLNITLIARTILNHG